MPLHTPNRAAHAEACGATVIRVERREELDDAFALLFATDGPDTPPRALGHDIHDTDLMHLARIMKDPGGIPAHGNQRSEWDAGCRFDYENPEYR